MQALVAELRDILARIQAALEKDDSEDRMGIHVDVSTLLAGYLRHHYDPKYGGRPHHAACSTIFGLPVTVGDIRQPEVLRITVHFQPKEYLANETQPRISIDRDGQPS